MALYRDEPGDFDALIRAAAANLGISEIAVSKDYWVCQVLAALSRDFFDDVVLKGGTSLEKLRLVERLSEDIDMLLTAPDGLGTRPTQKLLRNIVDAAAAVPGMLAREKHSSGGSAGTCNRAEWLSYGTPRGTDSGLADEGRILLELGQSGGPHPHTTEHITSLLGRQLQERGIDIVPFGDVAPFTLRVLHPARTLIEKLMRVHTFVNRSPTPDDLHWPRIGRQFYDLWALLGDPGVLSWLADRDAFAQVVTSALEISAVFGGDEPAPVGGFAASPAFDTSSPWAPVLAREHNTTVTKRVYATGPQPTFGEVCQRVQANARLL